ncbi:MAG: hypothetical protein HY689_11605 [Chloroflexi bacterium]|nr:hypothetical protein [Chloroflexota bacterium]
MKMPWLLLITTVPATPSRKRAFLWRALKQIGAVYLRDGVCVLPEREESAAALRTITARVEEFGGEATLIAGVWLPAERSAAVIAQSRTARAAEYDEIAGEAERFLEHVRRETTHHELALTELTQLEEDLEKLQRWARQIRSRDYFGAGEAERRVTALLDRCAAALALVRERTSRREGTAS